MHLTPPSSNAILSSRASILESQETRQLLRVSDKYHGTINVNLAKNDIIVRVQLKIKKNKSVYIKRKNKDKQISSRVTVIELLKITVISKFYVISYVIYYVWCYIIELLFIIAIR